MAQPTGDKIEQDVERAAHAESEAVQKDLSLGGLSVGTLLKRVWTDSNEDDILDRAAELAYYFLFALFPALIFISAMFGLFASTKTQSTMELMIYMKRLVPPDAFGLVQTAFSSTTKASSGKTLTLGGLATLWSAAYGMSSAQTVLNVIFRTRETRPFWKAKLIAIALTLVIFVLVFVAMMLLILGDDIAKMMARHWMFGPGAAIGWKVIQVCAALFFLSLVFSITYHWGPDRERHRWKWISPGSVVGIAGWVLVSVGFRVYLHFFNTYAVTYGSLGAVIILLTWFYVSGLMLLLGAEINAVIERAETQSSAPHSDSAAGIQPQGHDPGLSVAG